MTGDRFDRIAVIVITVLAGITFAVFLPAPSPPCAAGPGWNSPHGVAIRYPLGTGYVPWSALAPGHAQPQPTADRLVLTVARPDLVVRHGLALWTPAR